MMMTLPRLFLALALCLLTAPAFSQTGHQTLRGVVLDHDTRIPLIGANVLIVDTDPILGTATDTEGRFVLQRVPLGRQTVQVRYIGYTPKLIPNVLVRAGQETVLEITLREEVVEGEEVVIRPTSRQSQPLNDLAAVSARGFSVEETRRYAGAVDDPARLASAFAGVAQSGSGVSDNALSIRGNAPKGVLWHLEGVPIPNPNHFAGLSVAGGGGLTLFSGQLLANSDVFTGAFPAEYGNALSGVFDMRFRTGNPATREHTMQVGLLGLEVASEGPFRRGGAATYLFNYRYSTLGLLLPILQTEAGTTYQDLAFKLAFPTTKGRFEVWGLGGLDGQDLLENHNPAEWEYGFWDRTRFDLGLGVAAGGVTHHLILGQRTYLRTSLAGTARYTRWDQQRLADSLTLQPDLRLRNTDARAIVGTTLAHKVGARHFNRTGITAQQLMYDLDVRAALENEPPLRPIAQGTGNSTLIQAFTQSRFTLTTELNLTAGVHVQHFALSGHTAVEPRLGVVWAVTERQSVQFGYGLHSQTEDLRVYLAQPTGTATQPNRNLDFARAHHLVAGTSRQLSDDLRMQVEAYAQRLFDVPVIADSSFSLINFRQDWTFAEPLVNKGRGENYGVEVTLDRALRDGFYYLLTGSLFTSRYQGGDGIWRPTRFDQGYLLNALAGREFQVNTRNLLGVNVRVAALGSERRSPVDEAASALRQEVIYDETRAFAERWPSVWLVDLTLTYRRNGQRLSSVWALQLKNALAAKDTSFDYNYALQRVERIEDGFPLPVLSYKLEF